MTVEFALARAPRYRVAFLRWSGPWSDRKVRSQFEAVARWARANGLRTGKWVFREPGERQWETGIEVPRGGRSEGRIRIRTLRAATVARAVFDPEVVSPEVIYHGLNDWLRWRRREKKIRAVGSFRELYSGNPWTDRKAWSRTEIQYLVRR